MVFLITPKGWNSLERKVWMLSFVATDFLNLQVGCMFSDLSSDAVQVSMMWGTAIGQKGKSAFSA